MPEQSISIPVQVTGTVLNLKFEGLESLQSASHLALRLLEVYQPHQRHMVSTQMEFLQKCFSATTIASSLRRVMQ